MKKVTKSIIALVLIVTPLLLTACEQEIIAPTLQNSQDGDSDDHEGSLLLLD